MLYETWVNINIAPYCRVLRNIGMVIRQTNVIDTPKALPWERPNLSRDCQASKISGSTGQDWRDRSTDVAINLNYLDFELLGPSVGQAPWNQGWMDEALNDDENLCVLINFVPDGTSFELVNSAGVLIGQSNPPSSTEESQTVKFTTTANQLGRTFKIQINGPDDLTLKYVRVVRNCT